MKILIDKTLYVVGFFSIILFGVFIFGVFMLTGCESEDTSVTAKFLEVHYKTTTILLMSDVDYMVNVEYNNELYVCEFEYPVRGYEYGDNIEVYLVNCSKEETK